MMGSQICNRGATGAKIAGDFNGVNDEPIRECDVMKRPEHGHFLRSNGGLARARRLISV
jgi:hypothetical protein